MQEPGDYDYSQYLGVMKDPTFSFAGYHLLNHFCGSDSGRCGFKWIVPFTLYYPRFPKEETKS